jgi:hypothetical protein
MTEPIQSEKRNLLKPGFYFPTIHKLENSSIATAKNHYIISDA